MLHVLIAMLVVTGGAALMILGFINNQLAVYFLGTFIMIAGAVVHRTIQDKKDHD